MFPGRIPPMALNLLTIVFIGDPLSQECINMAGVAWELNPQSGLGIVSRFVDNSSCSLMSFTAQTHRGAPAPPWHWGPIAASNQHVMLVTALMPHSAAAC